MCRHLRVLTIVCTTLRGDAWHRLRNDHFEQIDFSQISTELAELLKNMMRSDPARRIDAVSIYDHPIMTQVRLAMDKARDERPGFKGSALSGEHDGWVDEIFERARSWDEDESMEICG